MSTYVPTGRPSGQPMGERSLRILALAGRVDGVNYRQVVEECGVSNKLSAALLTELRSAGHLHNCKVSRVLTHYFTTPAAAQEWAAKQSSPIWQLDLPHSDKSKQRPPRTKKAAGDVITPNGVKHTVCNAPTFDARFQVDPNTRVVGGFSTMGIGRYIA